MANCLRIISWNVNGLQNPIKLKKCLTYIKSQQAQLAFIQETHLLDSEVSRLKRDWVGQVFHSSYANKKHGVAILVHKKLNLTVSKEHKDSDGRVICLEAVINGVKVNLCNIYGPNQEDADFFHYINKMIGDISTSKSIIAGDYNQVVDGVLDKTTYSGVKPKDRMAIELMMKDLNLVDIWRVINPKEREYTFYSHRHKSHSRIDYFLISNNLVQDVSDCSIGPIALTDHATVHLGLILEPDLIKKSRWRLNVSLLHDTELCKYLEQELDNFFELNMGSTERVGTVWEASKAYIRGKLIAYASKKKKEQMQRINTIETELKTLEKRLSECYDEILLRQICDLKLQINDIYNKKVEYALFRLNTNFYESGEKAGKLLARQLKRKEANFTIPAIKDESGIPKTSTGDINDVFFKFYNKLYESQVKHDLEECDRFFSKFDLPKLTIDQQTYLDSPITVEEVKKAISLMRPSKSPGVDGFPSEYYKKFADKLAPILTEVFKESLDLGKMPDTFNEALISLIHKKDKDPMDPGSFRPVSLINVDCKILTKVIAIRMENILPHLIHMDQVGFVKGRTSSDNVRRLLHLMWQNRNNDTPVVALSLDAHKAFDRVEWSFLQYTLKAFGFGEGLIKWVSVIYADPRAAVSTNGLVSPFFKLQRGTKQGDPLSPLLFTLFLEPLAAAIRHNENIKGVVQDSEEHKMFLYADDILLLIRDPSTSVPEVLSTIEHFSRLSGYLINWQKSEAMPVSKNCFQTHLSQFQFRWTPVGMKYLGIKLSPELNNIISINIEPLLHNLKNNIDKWKLLNITLWGKVNTIKMLVAPQFNYISMMVPLIISNTWYKKYNELIKTFLWNGKKPRIGLKKLSALRETGGMALPDLELYNIAFELNKLSKHWKKQDLDKGWVKVERALTTPFEVIQLLSHKPESELQYNPIIQHSQWAWNKAHKILGISSYKQTYSSVWNNPAVRIGKSPVYWKKWLIGGVQKIEDLYRDNNFMSFAMLRDTFNLTDKGDFWKYLQIRSSVGSVFELSNIQGENPLQAWLNLPKNFQTASMYYKKLLGDQGAICEGLRLSWQKDLNINIMQDMWENVVSNVGWATRDARSKFIHYKIIHRFYFTPSRLFKMGLLQKNTCWKCNGDIGTYIHVFWECPLVAPFWTEVVKYLERCIGLPIPASPQMCLLGSKCFMPPGFTMDTYKFAVTGFLVAARLILRIWKSPHKPQTSDWIKMMTETASYERLLSKIHDTQDKTSRIWTYFFEFVKGSNSAELTVI